MKRLHLACTLLLLSLPIVCLGRQLPANALFCTPENLGGRWENVDSSTRGITKIDYNARCSDAVLIDPETGKSTKIRSLVEVFGACHPSDCEWGSAESQRHSSGSEWFYSIYDQGFARKIVWMKLESNDQLTVAVEVNYRGSRPDRTTWHRFNRVERQHR